MLDRRHTGTRDLLTPAEADPRQPRIGNLDKIEILERPRFDEHIGAVTHDRHRDAADPQMIELGIESMTPVHELEIVAAEEAFDIRLHLIAITREEVAVSCKRIALAQGDEITVKHGTHHTGPSLGSGSPHALLQRMRLCDAVSKKAPRSSINRDDCTGGTIVDQARIAGAILTFYECGKIDVQGFEA